MRGCEPDLSAKPISDKNPSAEHKRIAARGVWPLLVRPNMLATRLGRYCCDSMKTLREAPYRSLFAVVYADTMKNALSTFGNAVSEDSSAATINGDLVDILPLAHILERFGLA